MGTEYNKYHLSECMKIVILLKGGMFEIFYDLRCFAMFRKFLLSTHFTNRAILGAVSAISFRNSDKTKVAILELKTATCEKDMKVVAQKALQQIEAKQYAKEFLELPTVQSIETYGIAFFNKQCFIISKKIM